MKKTAYLIIVLCLITPAIAQTGINTKNPQAVLHVDGNKDNNPEGLPTTAQQANDVVVTSKGNIGVGTITPKAKVDINGKDPSGGGALRIADGTQGTGKVLTSDGDGIVSWTLPAIYRQTIMGIFPSSNLQVLPTGTNVPRYSGVYIDLTEGRWVVNGGLTFNVGADTWIHAYLSSSNTAIANNGFIHMGPSTTNTAYAGLLTRNSKLFSFISGSSVINVTVPTLRMYLMIENKPNGTYGYRTGNFENYFYAIPIN